MSDADGAPPAAADGEARDARRRMEAEAAAGAGGIVNASAGEFPTAAPAAAGADASAAHDRPTEELEMEELRARVKEVRAMPPLHARALIDRRTAAGRCFRRRVARAR